jgi:hypothetical protein
MRSLSQPCEQAAPGDPHATRVATKRASQRNRPAHQPRTRGGPAAQRASCGPAETRGTGTRAVSHPGTRRTPGALRASLATIDPRRQPYQASSRRRASPDPREAGAALDASEHDGPDEQRLDQPDQRRAANEERAVPSAAPPRGQDEPVLRQRRKTDRRPHRALRYRRLDCVEGQVGVRLGHGFVGIQRQVDYADRRGRRHLSR